MQPLQSYWQSQSHGFVNLGWEPPSNWIQLQLRSHQGWRRIYDVEAAEPGDRVFFKATLDQTGLEVQLRIDGSLARYRTKLYHVVGTIRTGSGHGHHPYWARLSFTDRGPTSFIAVQHKTVEYIAEERACRTLRL